MNSDMGLRQRIRAVWLLAVFLLANAAPLLALGLTDGMAGMACCRRSVASCCKRKAVHGAPAYRAGHSCGTACCGTPAAPAPVALAVAPPVSVSVEESDEERTAIATAGFAASGIDRQFWQRPPPGARG